MSKIIPGDVIFKGLVGSHAYGTNIEGSDKDYKGVYIQSPESVLHNGYVPQVIINKDECYYELRRFIELCLSANPTILELLFLPKDCVIYEHSIFKKVKILRRQFLTKKCNYSFGGYARQQISKASGLDKKMNWGDNYKYKKTPLDFCYIINQFLVKSTPLRQALHMKSDHGRRRQENYSLKSLKNMKDIFLYFYDPTQTWATGMCKENANEVHENPNIPRVVNACGVLYFNRSAYSQYCKKYKEYKVWLKERNTQRYVDIDNHGQQIDGKNMLHCIRLIETGLEISQNRNFNVKRNNADYLISIRKGKLDLKTLLKKANDTLEIMDKNFKNSDLPDSVDSEKIWNLVKVIRKSYYKKNVNKL